MNLPIVGASLARTASSALADPNIASDPLSAVILQRRHRQTFILALLSCALALVLLIAAGFGAVPISLYQTLAILASLLGVELPWNFEAFQQSVLLTIRLPRVFLGAIVGAGLAVSGAALQGLFRNPLADPGLIGVSTGAALAAATAIVLRDMIANWLPDIFTIYLVPLAAFGGGLCMTATGLAIATRSGRTDVTTLLLTGIALNAISGAAIGVLIFISTDQQLRDLNFWLLGSLSSITWNTLIPIAPLVLTSSFLLMRFSKVLNALMFGEDDAHLLGYAVQRAKRWIIVLAALTVGVCVALTGIIGFVGLVVPHLIRLLQGGDHRLLFPMSALLGAALLPAADLIARLIVLPAELPIGIVMSCVGGPFFLWLLVRRHPEQM